MIGLMVETDPKATKSYGPTTSAADPYLWLMDPDPDPSIFIIDLQYVCQQKTNLKKSFYAFYFLKVLYFYIIFQR